MKKSILAVIVMFVSVSVIWTEEHPSINELPKLISYSGQELNEQEDMRNYTREDMRKWGLLQPVRFISVDPLSDKYPSMTLYPYTLNNPIIFVDPTGMWVAEYDEEGNIVNAVYEDGETYEDLYTQLGISAEEFSGQFGIDLSKGIATT